MKRRLIIAAIVIVFVAISFLVARWLNNDTVERARVVELLRAQSRGDASGMRRRLADCGDPACIAVVRGNAQRLRGSGELKVALYQSGTAHSVASRTRFTRVVWFTRGRLTTVQCVLVRRQGNALSGMTVSLLRVTAPIERESGCPA